MTIGGGILGIAGYVTWLCLFSFVRATSIDYSAPVRKLQRAIEEVRLAEYRSLKFTLLLGMVAWLPVSLIVVEAITKSSVLARVPMPWLLANILFRFACFALGQVLSRRYLERNDLSTWLRALVESLSGHAIRVSRRQLSELARFEREDRL